MSTLSLFARELQDARECITSLNHQIGLFHEDSLVMMRKSRLQVTEKLENILDVHAYSISKYSSMTKEKISDLEETNNILSQKLETGHSVVKDLERLVKEAQIEMKKSTEESEARQKMIEQLEIYNEKLRSKLEAASQAFQTCHQCDQVDQSLEALHLASIELAKSLPTISDFLEYIRNTDKKIQVSSQLTEELKNRELECAMLLGKLSTLQNDMLLKQTEYNESLRLLQERLNSSGEEVQTLRDRCARLEDDLETARKSEASLIREKSELCRSFESMRIDRLYVLREEGNAVLQLEKSTGLQERFQEECSRAQEQLSWEANELQALTDQVVTLEGELFEARAKNLTLSTGLQRSDGKIEEAHSEIQRLKLEKDSLVRELGDSRCRCAAREEELESTRAEQDKIKDQLEELEVKNFALAQELSMRERELAALGAQNFKERPSVILRIELEKLREQSSKEIRLLQLKVADLEEELLMKK